MMVLLVFWRFMVFWRLMLLVFLFFVFVFWRLWGLVMVMMVVRGMVVVVEHRRASRRQSDCGSQYQDADMSSQEAQRYGNKIFHSGEVL